MKTANQIVILLLFFCIAMTSCEKELIEPATNTEATLQARAGHVYPDRQCGPSRSGSIQDDQGNTYGSAEILNDEANIYVLLSMHNNFFLESVFANFGTTADIPVDGNTMVTEDFMFQDFIPGGKSTYTVIFPTSALPVCNDVVLHTVISERNFFGQTVATHHGWLGTNPVYDGYFYKYCLATCN